MCISPVCTRTPRREKLHTYYDVNSAQFVYFTAYIYQLIISSPTENLPCIEFVVACLYLLWSAQPSEVFCSGDLLRAVTLAAIFNDSKEFVDRPLRANPMTVLQAFQAIPQDDATAVRQFVLNWTEEAGLDLVKWVPPDWVER